MEGSGWVYVELQRFANGTEKKSTRIGRPIKRLTESQRTLQDIGPNTWQGQETKNILITNSNTNIF